MRTVITIILFGTFLNLQAQQVSPAIGLRLGGLSGVTFKYVDDDLTGFEIIVGGRDGGMNLTGLLQRYRPIATGRTDGLFFFIGGGAHAGYVNHSEFRGRMVDGYHYHYRSEWLGPVVGADFITGIAFHFRSIPLHLSLDYKPYLEFSGRGDFRADMWDLGFSVKYAINQ